MKQYTDSDLHDVMKRICSLVEQEGLADGHRPLERLLQQKLVLLLLVAGEYKMCLVWPDFYFGMVQL